MKPGFVGTGEITSAIVTGLSSATGDVKAGLLQCVAEGLDAMIARITAADTR
jgi:hypothetical protein